MLKIQKDFSEYDDQVIKQSKFSSVFYQKLTSDSHFLLKFAIIYGIMNAKAFIILYPNALADTQIRDLFPAIGRLYHMRFAYMV